ncbi:MAG: DUF2066 domain-containing protein [Gammaproteobacteria bacterium]
MIQDARGFSLFHRLGLVFAGLCFALTLLPRPAHAVLVNNLYKDSVAVATRDRDERLDAFKQALAQVLVKMTGDGQVSAQPNVANLLDTATRYVQQYVYQEAPGGQGYNLTITFDGKALTRDLVDLGLPVWPAERPATLLWLGVENQGQRSIVSGSSSSTAAQAAQQAAQARGVPILLPLMDLQDKAQVSYSDIAGGFYDDVLKASQRYKADDVLVARVQNQAGGWVGRWHLSINGRTDDWQDSGATLQAVVQDGINQLSDRLAARMASSGTTDQASALEVSVKGIDTLSQYVKVRDYLKQVGLITLVRAVIVKPDEVVYLVRSRGTPKDLERVLLLGDTLQKAPTPAPESFAPAMPSPTPSANNAPGTQPAAPAAQQAPMQPVILHFMLQ